MVKKVLLVSLVICSMFLMSCGSSSSSSSSTSAWSFTGPTLAVTSPTASSSSTASMWLRSKQVLFGAMKLTGLSYLLKKIGLASEESLRAADEPTTSAPTEIKPYSEMKQESIENKTASPDAVAAKITNLISKTNYSAPCFGPGWVDNATGGSVSRPTGDLGMVYANMSNTDDTACAAAQLNALIAGTPQFAQKLLLLQDALIAAENSKGKALPDAGGSLDASGDLPTFNGFTIDEAKVERLADRADGKKVYKTTFRLTANAKTGSVIIYHTPLTDDNASFEGLLQAVLPHTASQNGSGTHRGISMVYKKEPPTLTVALDVAANRETDSTDFFGTNGRIAFTKAAFGEDGHRFIWQVNETTNAQVMHYAWQAGQQDNSIRAFAVQVDAGTVGAQTGKAYFGFGVDIAALTDSTSTIWPSKMFCHWLGYVNSNPVPSLRTDNSIAKVQKQTFSQTGGKFKVATSTITFAPTNNCNTGGAWTVSSATQAFLNSPRTATTNDLVSPGTDISAVTVPTYSIN
ncbi:MAG: hypothetical protein HY537_12500 [Deltaproteobacteria bacterium]|nr:hypothetical protein [Deltaproteobacteria bacterium]